ncbi:TPA: ParA family protein [Elizabethkingia anophelis]|jgi:chromosome partitioning protein
MKAKIISIFTQKGGVAKTTSTINIAGVLAELGYKTLLIDFDTQSHLSLGYGLDEDISYSIENFLNSNDTPIYTLRGKDELISIVSGSLTLVTKGLNKDSLKKAIKKIENDFDFILIDCPPKPISADLSFGEIAVFASDYIVSPVDYDVFTLDGVTKLIMAIDQLKQEKGLKAEYLGFFFARVEENTRDFKETYRELMESDINELLFRSYIRKNAFIRTSTNAGESAVFLKPFSPVSMDYRKLTDELLSKLR